MTADARISGISAALIPRKFGRCERAAPESACPLLFIFSHIFLRSHEVGVGFCPIFGIWQDAGYRRLAKCDAGSSRTGGFFPPRQGFSVLLWNLLAHWRNVGFSRCAAHTLAACSESRTQRRHAPHGGERCPLWKGARMQTVQGVTLLPSCSGKRQSH